MIETLSKMSGVKHETYTDGKSVTRDVGSFFKMSSTEPKVTYNSSTVEKPVISYNDMASIPPCNSMVFRAGDMPIWNRNETALPMSWRLFKNTITNPGKEYTLQTIPSLSTAKDFDVKQNQPNFTQMFDKRLDQAGKAEEAREYYKSVYGLTDDDIEKLDIDVYSDEIMEIIGEMLNPNLDLSVREENPDAEEIIPPEPEKPAPKPDADQGITPNQDLAKVIKTDKRINNFKNNAVKMYAGGLLSKSDLINESGQVNHQYDAAISSVFSILKSRFAQDNRNFYVTDNWELFSADRRVKYIGANTHVEDVAILEEAADDANSRVNGTVPEKARYDHSVTDDFYRFLCKFNEDWPFLQGQFSQRMYSTLTGTLPTKVGIAS